MDVECVPLTSFVHGTINAHQGRDTMIPQNLALDLERAGLVRIKMVSRRVDRPAQSGAVLVTPSVKPGNLPAAGGGAASSVSPVAQASPQTTSNSRTSGETVQQDVKPSQSTARERRHRG